MKIENRQRALVIAAAAILVLLVGDSVIRKPLVAAWKERSARLHQLKHDVDMDERLISQRTTWLARWERMKTNSLPVDKSMAESKVLNALESWTQDSGIRIERRQPQWREDQDLTLLELYIDATGSINSVRTFMYDMERDLSKLALRIEQVDISRRDNGGQQIGLSLQLTGLVIGAPTSQNR